MAGALLDVGEGVAGGGVVGEGGVAEVVEGPEGFRDAGCCKGGAEVLAGEACGVEWCAFVGVAEDEFVVAFEGGVLPVVGEEVAGAWSEVDRSFACFRFGGGEA